jgi:hypothetical protein
LKDATDAVRDIGAALDAEAGAVEAAGFERQAVALAPAAVVFGKQVDFAVDRDVGVGAQRRVGEDRALLSGAARGASLAWASSWAMRSCIFCMAAFMSSSSPAWAGAKAEQRPAAVMASTSFFMVQSWIRG